MCRGLLMRLFEGYYFLATASVRHPERLVCSMMIGHKICTVGMEHMDEHVYLDSNCLYSVFRNTIDTCETSFNQGPPRSEKQLQVPSMQSALQ